MQPSSDHNEPLRKRARKEPPPDYETLLEEWKALQGELEAERKARQQTEASLQQAEASRDHTAAMNSITASTRAVLHAKKAKSSLAVLPLIKDSAQTIDEVFARSWKHPWVHQSHQALDQFTTAFESVAPQVANILKEECAFPTQLGYQSYKDSCQNFLAAGTEDNLQRGVGYLLDSLLDLMQVSFARSYTKVQGCHPNNVMKNEKIDNIYIIPDGWIYSSEFQGRKDPLVQWDARKLSVLPSSLSVECKRAWSDIEVAVLEVAKVLAYRLSGQVSLNTVQPGVCFAFVDGNTIAFRCTVVGVNEQYKLAEMFQYSGVLSFNNLNDTDNLKQWRALCFFMYFALYPKVVPEHHVFGSEINAVINHSNVQYCFRIVWSFKHELSHEVHEAQYTSSVKLSSGQEQDSSTQDLTDKVDVIIPGSFVAIKLSNLKMGSARIENEIGNFKLIEYAAKVKHLPIPKTVVSMFVYGIATSCTRLLGDELMAIATYPCGSPLPSQLEPQMITQIIRDIENALRYLHSLGYVYCDLHPGNIVLRHDIPERKDGMGMLVDFEGLVPIGAPWQYFGIVTYSSISYLCGGSPHPQDDLEALLYVEYKLRHGSDPIDVERSDLVSDLVSQKLNVLRTIASETSESLKSCCSFASEIPGWIEQITNNKQFQNRISKRSLCGPCPNFPPDKNNHNNPWPRAIVQ